MRPNPPQLSEGVKFGIAAAVFCFAIGFGYELFLGAWLKLVPAWINLPSPIIPNNAE